MAARRATSRGVRPRLPFDLCAVVVAGFAVVVALGPPSGPTPAAAQRATVGDDPTKPLVYVFSLDAQDGAKAIDGGEAPFLASLTRGEQGARATYYKQSRGIMVSETNPNHTAMATGAYGKSSGISGNSFAVYDQAAKASCPMEGGSMEPGRPMVTSGQSATCLQAETFFAAMKRLSPETVTAGIFGKPKLGRIFATKRIDPAAYDADHLWAPCEQTSDDPPYCRNVAIDPVQRYTDDNVVMDEILRTVDEGVPADGTLRRPNLTFVNFPDIDQAGHVTGAGAAYTTQIGRTDQELKRFVDHQKEKGLWGRTVIIFTSDHSMDSTTPTPGRGLESAFGADADAVEIVLNGSVDMVYLKDRDRPDRDALLKRLRAKALGTGFADEALYRRPNAADGEMQHTLDGVHPGWNIAGERTGDLLVTSRPGTAFGDGVPSGLNPLPGNHGAPTTLDNTMAIVSGGDQVVQQTIDGQIGARFDDTLLNPGSSEQVDIAPTAMALFARRPPSGSQGRVLTEAFTPGTIPPVVDPPGSLPVAVPASGPSSCSAADGFRSLRVRPTGRGLRFSFSRRGGAKVRFDVFRQSVGTRVVGNRLVARFDRSRGFTWSSRGNRARTGEGYYFVRARVRTPNGRIDERRVAFRRLRGRFRARPAFDRTPSCRLLSSFKLERTVFGGRGNRALSIAFRLESTASAQVEVLRGGRVVKRYRTQPRRRGTTHRLRLASEGLPRGDYAVRLTVVTDDGERSVDRLAVRRL